jgi:phage-related protein (TIGR01555 family)
VALKFSNGAVPSGFNAKVRQFPKEKYKARMIDRAAKNFGLRPNQGTDTIASLDYFTNPAARMGWGTDSLTEATQYELVRLSYDYWLMITLYTNHWLCRKIVDIPAADMIRAWPRIASEIDPNDTTKIDKVLRKTNTKANLLKAMQWGRLFGGAGALIVIEGQEHLLEEPLDIDSIELGSFKGVIPFDRWAGIQPSSDVSTNINEPTRFNLPKYYEVQLPGGGSFKVHASRILRFTGPQVPTPEYEARQDWGVSVIEVCFEEIRKRDNMSWNLLCLSYRANLISMKVPALAEMLSGASMNQNSLQQFQARMGAINAYMSSQNLMLLPEDGEMGSVSYSPSGWSDLYQQFQMDIAGAVGIPVVKLFGRTATGLAQTNDADMQLYYEKIGQEQDTDLRPQLDVLYPIICMSELGHVPEDLDLSFPSARVMGEDEKANLAKSIGDLILGAAGGGIITRSQALKELKQSSDITGIFTNITDEYIAKAEEDEKAGLGGLGEEAGMPGAGGPGAGPQGPGGPGQGTPPQPSPQANPEATKSPNESKEVKQSTPPQAKGKVPGAPEKEKDSAKPNSLVPTKENGGLDYQNKHKDREAKVKEAEMKLEERQKGLNNKEKFASEQSKAQLLHGHKKELMTLEQQKAEAEGRKAINTSVLEWAKGLWSKLKSLDKSSVDDDFFKVYFLEYGGSGGQIRGTKSSRNLEEIKKLQGKYSDSKIGYMLWDTEMYGPYTGDSKIDSQDSSGIRYTTFADIPVAIEYAKGEQRIIKNANHETVYDKVLKYGYGFIPATMGMDGDELDVILGEDEEAKNVYSIYMVDGGPDIDQREYEWKVCVGFPTKKAAEEAFCSMYPKDWMGEVLTLTVEEFKKKLRTGETF